MIKRLLPLFVFVTSCVAEHSEDKQPDFTTESKVEKTSGQASFADLVIELESNILWESVTDKWKTRRSDWIILCQNETTLTGKANLLIELESNILWTAVNADWSKRRDSWTQDLIVIKTENDIGKYLIELESYILWESVSQHWKNVRNSWIKDCQSL